MSSQQNKQSVRAGTVVARLLPGRSVVQVLLMFLCWPVRTGTAKHAVMSGLVSVRVDCLEEVPVHSDTSLI